jgi:transposase-like protein
MKESYQIAEKSETTKLTEYLAKNGQLLMPMVELIEKSRLAVDELIDDVSRAAVEAVLILSAISVAGEKSRGKKGGEIGWHGSQKGSVRLSNRKIRIKKPRLRKKGRGPGGEVELAAYEAMNRSERLGERIGKILMRGVSTRNYEAVIGEMAGTVGVKKSSVSREFIKASAKDLERLLERRFDDVELLVVYIDGLVFGGHHIICAVGVATDGKKHVLGLVEGASENSASATSLLESLVERGVDPSKKYLFVMDGSKALRKAIDAVFGENNLVQRCRNHKVKNVCEKLPEELRDQVKSVMKAAYKLPWKEGIAKLKKQAEWLKTLHPGAAGSLLEGLDETFTINRLNLSPSLRRCLGTTNIIESPYSGVRQRTRRVTRWKDGRMVLRWASSALLSTEKNFRRIMGYKDLWMLEAVLRDRRVVESVDEEKEIA